MVIWGSDMQEAIPDGEVRVDPGVLRRGALAAENLRETLGRLLADVEPGSATGNKALPGWLTGQALGDVMWRWRDDLARLQGRLEAIVEALDACARDYAGTDHANASNFDAALRPW